MLKIALNQTIIKVFQKKFQMEHLQRLPSGIFALPTVFCERESNSNAHACLPAKACYVVCVNTTDFQITE